MKLQCFYSEDPLIDEDPYNDRYIIIQGTSIYLLWIDNRSPSPDNMIFLIEQFEKKSMNNLKLVHEKSGNLIKNK